MPDVMVTVGMGASRGLQVHARASGRRARHTGGIDNELFDDLFEQWPEPQGLEVHLSQHATRQLDELGYDAQAAVEHLSEMSREEIEWTAEQLPSQHGREVWMFWGGSVRVLFDIEGDDLTIQGFGRSPRSSGRSRRRPSWMSDD
jgi:hypothetical protein